MKIAIVLLSITSILGISYFFNSKPKHCEYVKEKFNININSQAKLVFEKEEFGDFDGSYWKTYVYDIKDAVNDITEQVKNSKWNTLPFDNFRYGTDLEQFTSSKDKGFYFYKEDSLYMTNFKLGILSITNNKLIICETKTH